MVFPIRAAPGFGWTGSGPRHDILRESFRLSTLEGRAGKCLQRARLSAAASFCTPSTRELSLNAGAQYHKYDQTSLFVFDQKRIFISLRYNAPELWKFSR